ncbi:putative zinc metalloprotease [Nocardioides baekrokdamisoli]|uniref:Putative zinc metalloprotease n=1 Tax=Nocardioides baekrokdamisoli TaxID=1804624 RepID=A0A3G9J3N1_9ACTN|nr:putative zinc metalloprotease [Nocardioides baekrokdamisoli]
MLYLGGVILFILGVAASIGLHEMGHLIPGKLYNVKITQYFIGFGRTIWSRQRGETEYGLKAVPLGGYVKLVGMLPPGPEAAPGTVPSRPTGMFSQLISDARAAEYEHVGPHDHGRLFYQLPWWKKVVIMGSGVATNIVLALALYSVVFMGYGVQSPTLTIGVVNKCVLAVRAAEAPTECPKGAPASPAAKAGLEVGDTVTTLNGVRMENYDQFREAIRANGTGPVTIGIVRGGRPMVVGPISTVVNNVPSDSDPTQTVRAGFLGVEPDTARQQQGFGFVLSTMKDSTRHVLSTLGHMPQRVYHVARAALGLETRDPNGPMSIVGAGRISGEVVQNQAVPLGARLMSLVLLLAGLNLFLGLVNLVPLPPFDGGGIATTLVDAIRRGWARVRRRPDPGALDSAKLLPVTYVGAALILVISVVLIYADIVAPVKLS